MAHRNQTGQQKFIADARDQMRTASDEAIRVQEGLDEAQRALDTCFDAFVEAVLLYTEVRDRVAPQLAIPPLEWTSVESRPALGRELSNARRSYLGVVNTLRNAVKEVDDARLSLEAATRQLSLAKGKYARATKRRFSTTPKAGASEWYRPRVAVRIESNGNLSFYFGGRGSPVGEAHGHYVLNAKGDLDYRREPRKPHGSQNFATQRNR